MTERVRWRAKHDALAVENERLKADANEHRAIVEEREARIGWLESENVELKKAVERARLQGMHDVTSLLLRDAQ